MNRFSTEHLSSLRNDVDVLRVIFDLRIPTQPHGTRIAFRCPCCRGFRSAICRRVNLARCFRCRKSFNVIDLVMAERPWGFRGAVQYLDGLLALSD